MSILAVMASHSNLKRKISVLKETEPIVREVVQGIPATSTTSKKKVEHGVPNLGSDLVGQLHEQGSWLLTHGDAFIGSMAENVLLQKAWSANGGAKSFSSKGFPNIQVPKFIKQCQQCFSEETLRKIDFTMNSGEKVVEEASRVKGYIPKHLEFPPFAIDVPVVEGEGNDEAIVHVMSFEDIVSVLSTFLFLAFSFSVLVGLSRTPFPCG
uniref:Uncharacterized protein n=1 Tax=Cannabis sativa TaxID=3483 RepID=A0A803PCI2_CANSA